MKSSFKRAVIAMSGGVDSSVAAALLKQQGYDVIGITMQIWPVSSPKNFGGCCGASAIDDARHVAQKLNIPHYVINFKKEFENSVIKNFIEEYKSGRTPNPCIRCNRHIKFDLLLQKAFELGAEYVATGHYARIENGSDGNFRLLKSIDGEKDQSYVLYMMTQKMLAHTLFPLGGLTKKEVRRIAKDMNLPVAEKKESQEICFVEDDDYSNFLKSFVPDSVKPGPIIDLAGSKVGFHSGIAFYTIGQRKGVGAHKGKPKYVVGIDRERNTIIIGDQKDTLSSKLLADNVSFISGVFPKAPFQAKAKIRYNTDEADAAIYPASDNSVAVEFKTPQRAVTPGQAVVFYIGDEVVGGGTIS